MAFKSNRDIAINKLEEMIDMGIDPKDMLEHIIWNYLSGDEALEVMEDLEHEYELNVY